MHNKNRVLFVVVLIYPIILHQWDSWYLQGLSSHQPPDGLPATLSCDGGHFIDECEVLG
jgi:hypothetical protein